MSLIDRERAEGFLAVCSRGIASLSSERAEVSRSRVARHGIESEVVETAHTEPESTAGEPSWAPHR